MGKAIHRTAAALARRGHELTLWFEEDFPSLVSARRLAVILYPLALAVRIAQQRKRFDVVLIHEPSGFWYGLIRRLVPSKLPPMLAHIHGDETRFFIELLRAARNGYASVPLGSRIKTPLFRLWQSIGSARLADQVLCMSTLDRRFLIDAIGVDPKRVTSVVNGVANGDFREKPERSAGRRILFVGGWLDVKGARLLPPIFSAIQARFPDARLTIVGSGVDRETVLRSFAGRLHPLVTVIPRLTTEQEMVDQYVEHDVLLVPSLFEGSPNAILEAMAAGLPSVSASVGGIPDFIEPDRNGLLFPPLDVEAAAAQVCRLFSEEGLAEGVGQAARESARKLTWDSTAEAVERAILAATVNERGGTKAVVGRTP